MKENLRYRYIYKKISYQFSKLGKLIARHYLCFLFCPLILSSVLSTGFLKCKINRNTDYLFSATNERASKAKDLVEHLFPMNSSVLFDYSRISKPNDYCMIIIYSKEDKNLLNEDIFEEIAELDRYIKNITVPWKGKMMNYSTLCGKKNGRCVESEVISLIPRINDINSGRYKIKYPLDMDEITFVYTQYIFSLGSVKVDKKGYVEEIKAVRLLYLFDKTDTNKHEIINQWKIIFNERMKYLKFRYISFSSFNSLILQGELKEYPNYIIPLLPVAFVIVSLFSVIICMKEDMIKSKPWMGPMACISACLAIISGAGLLMWCGVDFVDFNYGLFFSILAMEIDDAFILLAAWRNTNPEDSIESRMEKTYSEAAVSIFVTSFTSFLSFCIGMCSVFTAIRFINYYAGIFVCFTYVYLMTFFGSCLVISGYREQKKLHCITFRRIKESKTEDLKNVKTSTKDDFVMALFRDKLGDLLSRKSIKIAVILIFFCNLAISIWGLTFTEAGNNFSDAFKNDSTFSQFVRLLHKYFSRYSYPLSIIINEPINYADSQVQNTIENLCETFESHPNIADSSLRISWLKYYKDFQVSTAGKFLLSAYNMSNKIDFIDGLRNVFLKFEQAKQFNYDIVFNENFTEIIASRFLLPTVDITSESVEAGLMLDAYNIVDNFPISVIVDCLHFHLIEQMFLIKKATFLTALIASSLICLVLFLFLPNIKSVFFVAIIVFCIIFETIGYMSLWNVKLDMVSLVTLILCVGFSINYPTHISFSFIIAKDLNQKERIHKSLYEVGFPILQGFMTTIIGIIILAFQPFYCIVSFFKIIFIIALQTTFHAIFVIPTVLSIIWDINFPSILKQNFCFFRGKLF